MSSFRGGGLFLYKHAVEKSASRVMSSRIESNFKGFLLLLISLFLFFCRDSVVGIATSYGLDD
jgi:hypothetical protein